MTDLELQRALEVVKRAVVEAGEKLKPYFGNIEVESKGEGDSIGGVVTRLDKETEKYLEIEFKKNSRISASVARNLASATSPIQLG